MWVIGGGIGSFGGLCFTVSSWRVLTPEDISGSTGSEWVEHSTIGGKARSQYVGAKLKKYQFSIELRSSGGVRVRHTLEALQELAENGTVDFFIMNNKPVGGCRFRLTEISDDWGTVRRWWGLTSAKVTLTLEEYADGNKYTVSSIGDRVLKLLGK